MHRTKGARAIQRGDALLRREFIVKALKAAGMVTAGAAAPLATVLEATIPATASEPSIRRRAIPYGAAIRNQLLGEDPQYAGAFLTYCQEIVDEGSMKWFDLRPSRERFVFDRPDGNLAFAREHAMEMRGHTLVWYGAMPDWTNTIGSAAEAERELRRHIETVMQHYAGRIISWDVVNEPVPDNPSSLTELRPLIWRERLGDSYIEIALRTAAAADPGAQLVINEYDVEFVGDRYRNKREGLLRLVRSLRDKNVPLHAVGLQGHLHGDLNIDTEGLSAFVAEVRGLGLDVLVTELDVIDDKLPGAAEVRDVLAAARAYEFLAAIYAAARPTAVLTWGITDKYTWVPIWFKRKDGLANRPLPLDAEYRPKPLMNVIDHFTRDFA
jgi:endo-1,4-beta-xylanase